MPRLFPDHFTTAQVQQALTELQQGPHAAIPANAAHFPLAKGIYFWYMRPEGYQILSQHIAFPVPYNGQTIDQYGNHLVYLGTAGANRGAANGAGLHNRIMWHLCQHHTIATIRSGFLSTLRASLGPLLADDLIEINGVWTEELVNEFMANHLTVTCIAYEGEQEDIISSIKGDEHKLIVTLKPLFNLKKNSNAQVLGHPTHQIRSRRNAVKQATILRLNQL